MTQNEERVFRSINEPIRDNPSFDERWNSNDKGLITCWEVGRKKRELDIDLVNKIANGELPVLGWKGGVEKKLKVNHKYGSLNYLAQWQGIRGEDLNISFVNEVTLKCSKTDMIVTYTPDSTKYNLP